MNNKKERQKDRVRNRGEESRETRNCYCIRDFMKINQQKLDSYKGRGVKKKRRERESCTYT